MDTNNNNTGSSQLSVSERLAKMNKMFDSFRVSSHFGEVQTLTDMDIAEIRSDLSDLIDCINDQEDIEQYKGIKATAEKQLWAMNRAVSGMTLDRALEGKAREVDVTGHILDTAGNAMSTRQKMTITGEDGKRTPGYFTEYTDYSNEAFKKRILNKLREKFPTLVNIAALEYVINTKFDEKTPDFEDGFIPCFTETEPDEIADNPNRVFRVADEMCADLLEKRDMNKNSFGLISESNDFVVEPRNVAMSDVARLLDVDSILAKSTPLTIYNDGKPIQGCFMETAKGDDLDHIKPGSHFLDAKADCLDYSPALKQIADMQVLDFICGNRDRHPGNMIYQFDEKGEKIVGITGIDNDMSFTAHTEASAWMVPVDGMKYISESMAKKIQTITPEQLRFTINGNGLKEEEISAAVHRLEEVKKAIESGKISTMADDEFQKHPASDFSPTDGRSNTFSAISKSITQKLETMPKLKEELTKNPPPAEKEDVLDLFESVDTTQISQDNDLLQGFAEDMQRAEKGVHFGSSEFEDIKKELETLAKANRMVSENGKIANKTTFEGLEKTYQSVEKLCEKYLNRKEKQGKINAGGKTGLRISTVKKLQEFCRNRADSMEKTLNPHPELSDIREMKKESDMYQMEAMKEMQPEQLGDLVKSVNEICLKENCADLTRIQGAEQIKTILKFMDLNHISAKDCGLQKQDLLDAQATVKCGRAANQRLQEKEQPQIENVNVKNATVQL